MNRQAIEQCACGICTTHRELKQAAANAEWTQLPRSIRAIYFGHEIDIWRDSAGYRFTILGPDGEYKSHGEGFTTEPRAKYAAMEFFS